MKTEFPVIRKRVLEYASQLGEKAFFGETDLAFSVARQHNSWVTDQIAHKYWCAIYDLIQEGKLTNIIFENQQEN